MQIHEQINMRILVSEITSHQKNLPHLYKLFSHQFDTSVFIHSKDQHAISNIPDGKILVSRLPKSLLYWYLCIASRRFSYIFLSTGPEYAVGFSGIIQTLGFYVLSVCYPKKLILHIRNTNNYLPEKNFFSGVMIQKLRIWAVKHINRFTFDSKLTYHYFRSKYHRTDSTLQTVIAINYSDIRFLKEPDHQSGTGKIRIGMIGRIDVNRKDYDLIYRLQEQLGEISAQLEFVILGECKDPKSQEIIAKIEKYSKVIYSNGYLSDEEFEELGLSCAILFAPLTDNYGYGLTKETGAFGDAIYLHKKVIIPQFACTNGEFDPISEYYASSDDLLSIFRNLTDNPDSERFRVDKAYLTDYSTSRIFERITEELHL